MLEQIVRNPSLLQGAIEVREGRVAVLDEARLASPLMDELVRAAVFGNDEAKEYARWVIWEVGQQVGVRAASIHDLYVARGRGDVGGFTVPAINVRGVAYDTGRAIFRTANRLDAGAFILEIARSEIAYTDQRPAEYVTVMLAAAMREGYRGPVFVQGDHFQINAKKYRRCRDRGRSGSSSRARRSPRLLQHRRRHMTLVDLKPRRSTRSSD